MALLLPYSLTAKSALDSTHFNSLPIVEPEVLSDPWHHSQTDLTKIKIVRAVQVAWADSGCGLHLSYLQIFV